MTERRKSERHIWKKDKHGRECVKCNSRINTTPMRVLYLERDEWGELRGVNFYPRCFPINQKAVKE